jgi:hypothetical protein
VSRYGFPANPLAGASGMKILAVFLGVLVLVLILRRHRG